MKELDKVSAAVMQFMRGRYALDEVSNGKDELKFRRGGKTVLTIYLRENRFDLLLIFGKAEREKFTENRSSFSAAVQTRYDDSKTYHDGKWMLFPVSTMAEWEEVRPLILIKKKPNRKPFPRENLHLGGCGHRCDLCIHYTGGTISDSLRTELQERLSRAWGNLDWSIRCSGCGTLGCYAGPKGCNQLNCAAEKGFSLCTSCSEYPCPDATVASSRIEAKSILADDVTWAILPFVPGQYGN